MQSLRLAFVFVGCGAAMLLAAQHAGATSIPIDGSTEISKDTVGSGLITSSRGADTSLIIVINESTGINPIEVCTPGNPCSVTQRISADEFNATGTLGDVKASAVYGDVNITGPNFDVSDLTPGAPYQHDATVEISGVLAGFSASNEELFELALSGTGRVTLDGSAAANGSQVTFTSALTDFSGTATITPEPATFLLGGVSLGALFLTEAFRRKKSGRRGEHESVN